jgi:hypothetical protein
MNESFRAKWLLVGVVMFLVTGCMTYSEAALLVAGHDGQATVVQSFETRRRRSTRLTVEYEFTDRLGNKRKEQSTVSRHTPVPARGGTIDIRYTDGQRGHSRLSGHVNWVAVGFFGVSVLLIAFGIFALVREERATRPRRRRNDFGDDPDDFGRADSRQTRVP